MKILIINTYDIQGGAAKAAYKLHEGLLGENISSTMLVLSKKIKDSTVSSFYKKIRNMIIPAVRRKLDLIVLNLYPHRRREMWTNLFFRIGLKKKKLKEINPDIVHLQWIFDGFASLKEISK
ncbi:MAG: hypothetical protein LBE13_02760 [Bacteroidales bacterium]|jgi:hypothetical protein|nr:hypothetical protein [Bacteroidales bacterium]